MQRCSHLFIFFNDTATTEIYTLSLHDALPIFIWPKRPFIGEMCRLVDAPGAPGTVLITHTHNQLVWSPSHGNPLTPAGYRDRKSTRLNSSHANISYAVFCLKKKKKCDKR